ncbi:hypothetical protein PISL3812_01526 [Talaromyces islandicus]|uniref:Zn(2)-C6 fungal-type domain-containing protein n=1 Tax=Talaromyces islandicus TaxID=28573 RepID=A0A0U1LMD4_TALIS|nr:hypothetical protein PISL3812_01526 [Talaromyces islandicus]
MLIIDGPPLRLACDRCHKRKQRCTRTGINDNKPCERCREAGSQCVYSPPSRLGRPSNKSKRERQQQLIGNNNWMATGSPPSSTTTSPTPPPPSTHSFSLSASSVSLPTCMPMAAANGQIKTKIRRSHSTMAAASLRFKKPSPPPSVSSQFSDTTLSSSSCNFGSPALHAMDATSGNVSFQHFQFPRSQQQHYHEQAVSGSTVVPSPDHHPGTLFTAPEQQPWDATPQHHNNNMIFGPPTYNDTAILLQQQNQRQQPQTQPLYTVGTWPNLMAAHDPLQLQASQEVPIMAGPDGYSRWKWSGQPVADPQVAMNLGIPVTMTMDGNQPVYYYW